MKKRHAILIILLIVFFDQLLKFYVKTHFQYDEERMLLGHWFRLHFIENNGMAWGWKLDFRWGKVILTVFRLIAVIWGVFYIKKLFTQRRSIGFIICVSMIYAGALGNLIDSLFYGIMFNKGAIFNDFQNNFIRYEGVASLSARGYAALFHGNVVDMIYCPLFRGVFPSWFPFWGGQPFEFFSMVFNIADASISIGVIALLLFHKRLLRTPGTGGDNKAGTEADTRIDAGTDPGAGADPTPAAV
jgi:signal peptidase II